MLSTTVWSLTHAPNQGPHKEPFGENEFKQLDDSNSIVLGVEPKEDLVEIGTSLYLVAIRQRRKVWWRS